MKLGPKGRGAATGLTVALAVCLAGWVTPGQAQTARTPPPKAAPAPVAPGTMTPPPSTASTPCLSTQTAPLVHVTVGKSSLLKLQSPVTRILLGNPEGGRAARPAPVSAEKTPADAARTMVTPSGGGVADLDVILLSPNEIYLLGKSVGSTNMILLSRSGECTLVDIAVGIDTVALETRLNELLPGSTIKVSAAASSIVLNGIVGDAVRVDRALAIASAYAPEGPQGQRIVNMLNVNAPQQVMLEVKVAEVNKTLLDRLGVDLRLIGRQGSWVFQLLTNFLSTATGSISGIKTDGTAFAIDADTRDGLIKILAEPSILALSGQEGSFLAGGTVLIPTDTADDVTGRARVTLEEKDFGVSVKFTPTVLEAGRINLKIGSEVSELSPEGVGISAVGVVGRSILPLFTVRRAATTVQLYDGQSFMIGGLIKNNARANIRRFPLLGEIPVLGALFRSSDFQTDRSELVFIVTPRLVRPLPGDFALPTDAWREPNRVEFFMGGKLEGVPPPLPDPAMTPKSEPPIPPAGGFQVK